MARTRATVGLLAERLQIRHHSAVELAGRLERAGWIKRLRDDKDRREVLLQLERSAMARSFSKNYPRLHRRENCVTPQRAEVGRSTPVRRGA